MVLGLIVSHYSSSYVAIIVLVVAIVAHAVASRIVRTRLVPPALLATTVLLAGGAFLWNVVITHSANNVSDFATAVSARGLDILPTRGGNLISTYLAGNTTQSTSGDAFEAAAVREYRAAPVIHPPAAARPPRPEYRLSPRRHRPRRSARRPAADALKIISILIAQATILL